MFYYLQRNYPYIHKTEQEDDIDESEEDEQLDLFIVQDNTVFAKLIWFDNKGWHNDFLPIIQMESDAMCYKIIHILRDLSTLDLKKLHIEYWKKKYKSDN